MERRTDALRQLLVQCADIVADEFSYCISLMESFAQIGNLDPARMREGHFKSLIFNGLRTLGYATFAEDNYSQSLCASRQIDLSVWLPDTLAWLYLEVKPCGPRISTRPVVCDAEKLISDHLSHSCDRLRGVLVYGFRDAVKPPDIFPQKYKGISDNLAPFGFREIGIQTRPLRRTDYIYIQTGLWVTEMSSSERASGLMHPPTCFEDRVTTEHENNR